jgi:hypothetical protein
MEEYDIFLSPELGVYPAEFITAWNAEAECRRHGEADLASSPGISYDPTGLIADILLSVTTGIVGNALYELIKQALIRSGVPQHKHIHIKEHRKRDGSRLLTVDIDEE